MNFITIDGQRFECGSVPQALSLLTRAKETAQKLAQDQALRALQQQQESPALLAPPVLKAPRISVSSRALRSAAAQVKREIVETYAQERRDAEIRMLLEFSKRQSEDDESLLLLM